MGKKPRFDEQLRQAVIDSKLSARHINRETGIPLPTITRFLRQERGLNLETITVLVEFLGLELRPAPNRKAKP
ncbi:MAG TPA: hypothetical protein VEI07_04010 [Planctomycetaceae bacterium]|nr:hypothetical protein [Planctomycetaceae bacterium]